MNARIKQLTEDLLDILTRLENGMVYNGLTVDGCATYTEESHDVFVRSVKAIRTGITRIIEVNQALPDPEAEAAKLDPAVAALKQMQIECPEKLHQVCKIKTNGSNTEVSFAFSETVTYCDDGRRLLYDDRERS